MIVVDDLDERLHFAALVLSGFRHAACDLERIPFDAGDECVWEGMCFAAVVLRLENDNFLACVAAAGDDGLGCVRLVVCGSSNCEGVPYHSADFKDCDSVSMVAEYVSRTTYTSWSLGVPLWC